MRIKFFSKYLKLKKVIDFFLIIIIFSCDTKNSKIEEFIGDILIQNKNVEYIVFVPSAGCIGCISFSETLMKEHANDDQIFFINENVSSAKELSLKIGINVKNVENIHIMSHNLNLFENFIAPKVYIVSSKIIKELDENFIFKE
jgi:hypothetical protein